MSQETVIEAIKAKNRAKENLVREIASTWPKGSEISWDRNGHRQYGNVVGLSSCGGIKVQNMYTQKTYWIGTYDVLGYIK